MYSKDEYEHILYSDSKPPTITPKRPGHAHTWRWIILKIFLFASLELAFIALAWTAYKNHGIHLHINIETYMSKSLAQSFFSWLVIIWNTLAISALNDIVLYIFSAECFSQNDNAELVTGLADRVSILTSGLTDQIVHFFSGTATWRYKISLMMLLLLISSKGFVPGTISLDMAPVNVTLSLGIANVTYRPNLTDGGIALAEMGMARAKTFMTLEQLKRKIYGYSSENVLIPWPNLTYHMAAGADDSQFWYTSDVMSYDFNCNWTTPTAPPQPSQSDPGTWLWEVELQGQKTHLTTIQDIGTPVLSPLFPKLNELKLGDLNPLFTFVFCQPVQDNATPVNLILGDERLPKWFDPPIAVTSTSTGFYNITTRVEAASILICNPRPHTYTADITVNIPAADSLTASSPYLVAREVLPYPTIGNLFISIKLISLLEFPLMIPDILLGESPVTPSLTQLLFFCNFGGPCGGNLTLLPLEQIMQNMNRFFGSGMKAYLDGYNGPPSGSQALAVPNFKTFKTNVIVQENTGLQVVANLPFVLVTTGAFICTVFLLIILFSILRPAHLRTFDLSTINDIFDLAVVYEKLNR